VAILQISRITQRKGLAQDLPQPLAGGELGWAIDERKLYIGNGELEEGAPVVGNTEVLTEYSEILDYASLYTYKGEAAGYIVQTGETSGSPVTQSLQSRLDSWAIVTDFGAIGNGTVDCTAAINRAMFQLYCREVNPQIRRGLFFPAGRYIVTDIIKIPPYAKLYGEGANSSIIEFRVNPHTTAVSYQAGVLVSSGGLYYRSLVPVPVGIQIDPMNPGPFWAVETLPDYIWELADSLQQTRNNVGSNDAIPPRNVEISDMALATNQEINGLLINQATECYFNQVNFIGPLEESDLGDSGEDIAAVRWFSTEANPCNQINFNNCYFSKFTFATETDQVIRGASVTNSKFDTLYQGAVLDTDPTGFKLTHNVFDNIYAQGIVFDSCSLNISAYNMFYDVGNHFNGVDFPATSCILINEENNVSIGDMFERTTANSASFPRIALSGSSVSLGMNIRGISYTIDGVSNNTIANQMAIGTYVRTNGVSSELVDNNTGPLCLINTALIKTFKIDYTISRGTSLRSGSLIIAGDPGLTWSDDFTENAGTGITLSASQSISGILVSYTASSTGTNGNIRYSISHLN
jgi:hypothetical protein